MRTKYKELSFFQKRANSHHDGFHLFNDQGAYYFSYNRNGEALLLSQAYANDSKREKIIEEVLAAMQEQDRFKGFVNASGKPYLSLRNSKNEELLISRSFNSKDEMDNALDVLLTANFSHPPSLASAYLPTPAYIGKEGFHKFKHKNGKYYFSFNDKYGKPFLISQSFEDESKRDSEIESVVRLSQDETKWFRGEGNDGQDYFFCLKAKEDYELARSPIHSSEQEMMDSFDWIRGNDSRIGRGSAMIGGVLLSAAMVAQNLKEAKGRGPESSAGSSATISKSTTTSSSESTTNKGLSTFDRGELSDSEREKLAAERAQMQEQRVQEEMRLMEKRREEEAIRQRRKREEQEVKLIREKREAAERERLRAESDRRGVLAQRTVVTAEEVKPKSYIPPVRTEAVYQEKATGIPWWLVLAALVGLPLLFWWKGCSDSLIPPPTPPSDTAQTRPITPADPPQKEIAIITQEEEENKNTGLTDVSSRCELGELKFLPGTIESALAKCIENPDCRLPAKFQWYDTGFDRSSAHMSSDAYTSVKNLSELMLACDDISIDIYGHISNDESDVYVGKYQDETNISLSGIRARCTFRKLQRAGVAADRMTYIGKGKTDPLIRDDTQRAYERNRRTEIVLKMN